VAITHEQNITCSKAYLDGIAHEQSMICMQLFVGLVYWASANGTGKKKLHRMIINN